MEKAKNKKLGRRILSIALAIALMGLLQAIPGTVRTAYAAGNITVTIDTGASVTLQDTDSDGYYEIKDADDLYAFAVAVNSGNYRINGKLTEDIVVNETLEDSSRKWTPIGNLSASYYGIFDGAGHTVKGIYVNTPEEKYVGLFGCSNGTIKNVGVIDSYVYGKMYVGGVCGINLYGTVTDCYNTGSVRGIDNIGGVCGNNSEGRVTGCYNTGSVSGTAGTGGVCGYNYYGEVTSCYNTDSVSGTESIGGVCGYIFEGTVTGCYNTGSVSGDQYIGGICGRNCNYYGEVTDCYNTGSVSGDQYIGGVCGEYKGTVTGCYNTGTVNGNNSANSGDVCGYNAGGTMTNCYYQSTAETDSSDGTTYKTEADFTSGAVCWLLNNSTASDESVWRQDIGTDASPALDGPVVYSYEVSDTTFYSNIKTPPTYNDGVYEIDSADELLWFVEAVNGAETTINAKLTADIDLIDIDWTIMNSFAGTFDGNGHTISGLNGHIDLQDNDKVHGFIRTLADGGFVKNLTFTGAKVFNHEGDGAISAVIVYTNNGTVENCVVKSSNIHHGDYDALGVVVGVNAGTIRNCASISNTMTRRCSSSKNVCGFVWSNSGSIENCFNYDCTYQNSSNHYAFTGINNGTITNCYYYESSEIISDTVATSKTEVAFASGEVAYLLNGTVTDDVWSAGATDGTQSWYQTLSDNEKDDYPVLNSTHETVYQIKKYDCPDDTEAEVVYSNTNEDIIAEEHSFEGCVCRICKNVVHKEFDKEGFCTACGNAYEPAKQVSSEHHAELNATHNGYYAIETAGQLYWFAEYVNAGNTTANAVLTANLVVNASLEGTPREWTPIGNDSNRYNGTFDGNGKTVSGLYIYDIVEANDTGAAGLIGYAAENARIEKVGVIGSSFTITGKSVDIGGVCGYNKGSITNCYYTGTVSGNRGIVGGVCGANDGSIKNCYNTGDVSGSELVGGVCGATGDWWETAKIINCYNTGSVSGTNQVGGVCGYVECAIVTSCYNTGSVSGTNQVGGVCGYSYLGKIRNCYYDSEVYTGNAIGDDSSDSSSGVIEGKTTAQFASGEVAYLLNGTVTEDVWSAGATDGTQSWYQTLSGNETDDYPVLNSTHGTVYQIKKYDCPEDTEAEVLYSNTEGDIRGTEHSLEGCVCRICKNAVHKEFDKEGFCTVCGNGYEPAKQVSSEHHAELNATHNGYYAIETAGQLYWFAEYVNAGNTTANAVLTANLVVNASLEGTPREWTPIGNDANPYNGSFDGNGKTVSGLYIYDIVEANDAGTAGLIGCTAENARIEKVGVIGSAFTITGKNVEIGGVCGANYGSITNCYYTGTVSGNLSSVGGVCGYNDNGGSITNCYNTGDVRGTNQVGGVCGANTGSITNCYNTGNVSGSERVGGVCGYVGNRSTATTINCYNTGSVSGTNQVGGVCGYSYFGSIRNCYYDNVVYTGNAIGDDSSSSSSGVIEGKTTVQFASGEVAYLLNGTVTDGVWSAGATDGTQSWYQTLSDNDYPVLNSTHETVYQIKKYDCPGDNEGEVLYSNTEGDIRGTEHSYVNSVCTGCGKNIELTITLDEGGSFADGEYTFANDVHTIKTDKKVTITGTTTTETVVIASGVNANITLNDVSIDVENTQYACAFKIDDNSTGNVTITLADGSTNILESGTNCAGLQKNGTEGTLTIAGTGTLTATGGNYGAGIGGGYNGEGTGITINGGTIKATNGYGGAGIGGGYHGEGTDITISGGTVIATGGIYGAGIGGGDMGSVSSEERKPSINITISDGTVIATGGDNAAGIGGGFYTEGSNITISGGIVTAIGGLSGAGIGGGEYGVGSNITISGGSVKAVAGSGACAIGGYGSFFEGYPVTPVTPTLQNETPVYLFEIDNDGSEDIVINSTDYPDKHGTEEKIYAYLPAKSDAEPNEIQVGETVTLYYYDAESGSWVETCGSGNHVDTDKNCACDNCEYTFEHKDDNEDGVCDTCGKGMHGVSLAGHNLVLGERIAVNFHFELDEEVGFTGAYVEFSMEGVEPERIYVTYDEEKKANSEYTYEVAAKEMNQTITARFCDAQDNLLLKTDYSVAKYAQSVIDGNYKQSDKDMVTAMLTYGKFAEAYFSEGSADGAENLPAVADILTALGDSHKLSKSDTSFIRYAGSSLILLSNTTMRIYFELMDETETAIGDVTFTWGENKLSPEEYGKDGKTYYYVDVKGITPKNLGAEITITAEESESKTTYETTLTPLYYVKEMLAGGTEDAALINLLRALYAYYGVAAEYKNQ